MALSRVCHFGRNSFPPVRFGLSPFAIQPQSISFSKNLHVFLSGSLRTFTSGGKNSSPSIFVLADDFSGACDTGVQFGLAGLSTKLVTMNLTEESEDQLHPERFVLPDKLEADVLVIDTESRAEGAEAARERISSAYDLCAQAAGRTLDREVAKKSGEDGQKGPLWFKKMDSSLRGAVADELYEFMKRSGQRVCFFCPAFPEIGRKTVGGFHTLDGMPIAEVRRTNLDLHSPDISSSNLEAFLQPVEVSEEVAWKTQHIHLTIIRKGADAVVNLAQDFLSTVTPPEGSGEEAPYVFFYLDAEQPGDLEVIAQAASKLQPTPFLCGSSGLAKYVAKAFNVHGRQVSSEPLLEARERVYRKPAAEEDSKAEGDKQKQKDEEKKGKAFDSAALSEEEACPPPPVLLVIGSQQPNTLRQLDTLYASLSSHNRHRIRLLEWNVEEGSDSPLPPVQALENGDVGIVRLKPSTFETDLSEEGRRTRRNAIHKVADIARQICEMTKPENMAGMISTGGYMSRVLLRKLDALEGPLTIMTGFEERQTPTPKKSKGSGKIATPSHLSTKFFNVGHTAVCRIDYGPFKGLRSVTKGGRLGAEGTFLTALDHLQSTTLVDAPLKSDV